MEPARVSITVNGKAVEVLAEERLLDVLRGLGHHIPTLCHDERLTPYGGCRLCVVARRDDHGGLIPACSTPVVKGMVIETQSPDVIASRRLQLQLLALNHRMECPVCERRGDCRLQDLLHEYGVPDATLPFERVGVPRDEAAPVIMRDPEKCILCGKCVRLCDEVQGLAAIGLVDRGLGTRVATPLDQPLDCEFCGQCVIACPVAALVARPYVSETPVWLREAATTTCSFCSCGCQVSVETDDGVLQQVTSDVRLEPNHGKLCAKGWLGWDLLDSPQRITTPLMRRGGRLQEAGWHEALGAVAGALGDARHRGRPVVGIGSARLTCEDAYLMQRLLRSVVGTPHVDVGPIGGAGALVDGMLAATGAAQSTATLENLRHADLILVLRGDPTRTHPLVKTELVQGVRQRGQRIVLAHALSGGLEREAALHLTLEPASEQMLLRGIAAQVLSRLPRAEASCRHLPGFGPWAESLEAYTPEKTAALTGVSQEQLAELVRMLLRARRIVTVVVTGLGIPGDSGAVARAAVELEGLLGGGVLVLGEKANVQGVFDVGLHPRLWPGQRLAGDPRAARELERLWATPLPGARGWETRESLERAAAGEVGVLYLVGQDPANAWPRGLRGGEAVRGSDFVVVQDAFLTETARLADVVLPVAILGERTGTLVGFDGVRRPLRPALEPPRRLAQDGAIFQELAPRLGARLPMGAALEAELDALVRWPARPAALRRFTPAPRPPARPRWRGLLLDASPQLFRSGTVTSQSRLLQELDPSVVVRLAPCDAESIGVRTGQMLRVAVDGRELLMRARVDADVRAGTVVAPWRSGESSALVDESGEPLGVVVRGS
jgi:predicted molibdopterin-dependent oxidoreductase YjgC